MSLLGRCVPWGIHLMGLVGLAVPLAWGVSSGRWYGYCFQRTRNILAPWLAHTLALITFIAVGAMVLVE